MIFGLAFFLVLLLIAAYLFSIVRPGIKKIRGGIHLLHARGRDHAEIKFIHPRTNKALRFQKEIIGGIPTITLSLRELLLSDDEHQRLMKIIAAKGIKVKSNKSHKMLLLGGSVDTADDFAKAILADVLRMSKYTRFKFEDEGIDRS